MILGIFLTSCSNIGKREEITLKEKESLIVLIEDIKNNLQKGETELLEKTLPAAPLKLIAMESCRELGQKVNDYIVSFR